ncbi:3-oxoacyl-[acyl-carrier protein] reductase [Halarchaeum rubridurum]|uniref:3-oxoacyl-ACP reductase n=1 Tax=Halarchaeum rubridurum TaxID=489911 RepID=A0A830G5I8_9EURY|nr:SDR family NAD(P)-dependent oxidoreductase [Halarchaeum rubridurum]MBP1955618.1 3-oxoacyl-[acyl-carrier protein] reductase [Halarchaeum rubridurum]GGM76615.1 3-oxoacyl-ACP reductase [Halarchaeum rubridurum]
MSETTDAVRSRSSLEGKTAVVTGASAGIGRAITEVFAADGADVVVCSRTLGDVEAVAEAFADLPGDVEPVEADVTDRDDVAALAEATEEAFGGVDVLVNNAGGNAAMAPTGEYKPELWDQTVGVNLTGVYNVTHAFGDALRAGGPSAVVNVASMAGEYGVENMGPYSAAKAGVIAFTRSLAREWADADVRANAVSPGFIATEKLRENFGLDAEIERGNADRKWGTPAEVADLVRFLASDAASFVDGQSVRITGTPNTYTTPDV